MQNHLSGDFATAENIYREILSVHPDHPDALHLLGVIYYQKGVRDEAEKLISRAIILQPNASVFYVNLGRVFQAQGKMGLAISNYETALKIQPDLVDARTALDSLKGRYWLQAKA